MVQASSIVCGPSYKEDDENAPCVRNLALIYIYSIFFVTISIIVGLIHVIPGALGICDAVQKKSSGLVCAFFVCLLIIVIIDVVGLVISISGMYSPLTSRREIILSSVDLFLTLLAIVIVGNYNATKLKQDDKKTVSYI